MYILSPQFKYWLSLFYLNSGLKSPPSSFIQSSEIQDHIYCGCSIKAEAKVYSNYDYANIADQSPVITDITAPTPIYSMFGYNLNKLRDISIICVKFVPEWRSELARVLEVSEMSGLDGVWIEFGFSFDAMPTIDMVLYFRGSMKEDRDSWRKTEKT